MSEQLSSVLGRCRSRLAVGQPGSPSGPPVVQTSGLMRYAAAAAAAQAGGADEQAVKQLLVQSLMEAEGEFERMGQNWKQLQDELTLASAASRRRAGSASAPAGPARWPSVAGAACRSPTGGARGELWLSGGSQPSFGHRRSAREEAELAAEEAPTTPTPRRRRPSGAAAAAALAATPGSWASGILDDADEPDSAILGSAVICRYGRGREAPAAAVAALDHSPTLRGISARCAALEDCMARVRERRAQRERWGRASG